MSDVNNVTELCTKVFADLTRSDQRRKSLEYVNGLLRASGRKSIRNIAGTAGSDAAEQALHHFVSHSTWNWTQVRRALARHVGRMAGRRAWVLTSMLIPKAGAHSVGVGRRYCPSLRQTLNAQHAIGLWSAADTCVTPINWRLHLSGDWIADSGRRTRAAIPPDATALSLHQGVAETYRELADERDTPVVVDTRTIGAEAVVRSLRVAGAPLLARVPADLILTAYPGTGDQATATARELVAAARHAHRPVFGVGAGDPARACIVPVRPPAGTGSRPMLLLGLGGLGQRWPDELWLTDLGHAGLTELVWLTRQAARVDEDLATLGDRVGLRDFTGRSFTGWHRHTTLASAAHAVLSLYAPPAPAYALSSAC
jgi:syndecan 1